MKTRAKSATKKRRNVNTKQCRKVIVKIERVMECIPNEDSTVKQEDSISDGPILQLDKAIIVKQEDFIDEKPLSSETIATEQKTQIDVDDTPIISNRSHLDETIPNDDTDTYCTICKQSFSSSHYYNEHMTDFHNNNVPFARKTTVQPIIEDAPCYCRPCEYQFASRQCYRRHLITIHKMKLEPLQKCKPTLKARPNIVPVVDDPTNTCISCGYQFFQERNYRLHLINVHKMKLDTLQNSIPRLKAQPNITPVVDDPNYMCRSCIYQFSSKQSYKRHLTTVHNMKLSHKCRARPDIMPDVNDPNNTCRSCGDHRFANKITYRSHLIRIHNMDLEPLRCSRSNIIPQSNVSPVIDDPNYICRSCIYQFSSKQGYKRHLIAIHKVKLEPPRKGKPKLKPKPNITPVVDDPNNNCRSCNYQFTSKNGYRGHLLRTHKMKLKPSERSMPKLIPQPNILPVVDDPESNCRSCNHRFSSKQWYRSHLVNVHKMDLDLLSVEKLKVRQSISPVVDDPNNNCRPCNYQFSSKQAYRTHLIKVHKIKLESLRSNISRRR